MSLVHPVLEPSIALNATVGNFMGDSRSWLALQYSNRIVFRQILNVGGSPEGIKFAEEDVIIATPQPPMTMGNPDEDLPPLLGGAFFTAGRRKDLLVLQFYSTLVVVSVNSVDLKFELEGSWGLPTVESPRDIMSANRSSSSGAVPHLKRSSGSSSVSLATLAETGVDPFVASISAFNRNLSAQLSQLQVSKNIGLYRDMPPPMPSPDGTQIFLASRNKSKNPVLVVLSSYGKEIIRLEVDYIDIMTLGWINNDVVYFVYMNSKFHKKFQTASVGSKAKGSGIFGMGRRLVTPSLVYQLNVIISPDYLPARRDVGGSQDLVFQDYVLLGTRRGTYIRVNHQNGSWEPVSNAANIVGAVCTGENRLVVMNKRGARSSSSPDEFTYSVAIAGELHRVSAAPEISYCLSSGHNIDVENRFVLRLLDIGKGGYVLDYKRKPMRVYKVTADKVEIADSLPLPSATSARLTSDFLLKTEQALYTRDPNCEDNQLCKMVMKDIFTVTLDRPGLRAFEKRAEKSMWASFTSIHDYVPEVRIIEESHKIMKLKLKAHYSFTNRRGWHLTQLIPVHRNIALVTLGEVKKTVGYTSDATELIGSVGNFKRWEIYLVNFVGALSKSDPVKPRAFLVLESKAPDIPPTPLLMPGAATIFDNEKKHLGMHVYNSELNGFTRHAVLSVWKDGKHELNDVKEAGNPFVLDENEDATFFTDVKSSSDGVFLLGMQSADAQKIMNVLTVESPGATTGKSIVLANRDLAKATIWVFDSSGAAFRIFGLDHTPPERARFYDVHERMLKQSGKREYTLSPDFRTKYFREIASSDTFRPLPELASRVCSGSGVDAEAYLKSPDNAIYAVFRIQNKKLLEGFQRLEQMINKKCVGAWLPDILRDQWLSERAGSTIVSGVSFAAFWRLSEDVQKELCDDAQFDFDLLKKVRPP